MLPNHNLKLLVVGSGGREHALSWKLAQSNRVEKIFCAPGNGGTETENKCENVPIGVMEFERLVSFARDEGVDLIVIGPDNPLAEGIVDRMEEAELRVFGPRQEQAKIESSKLHAKQFMQKANIPTPKFVTVHSFEEGLAALKENAWARVIKADGLALGKGVFVCDSDQEAQQALSEIFEKKSFGTAGDTVLLEEKINGEELSLLMLCDGKTVRLLSPCQDHKRRLDGDKGANTGGMGAYSPVPIYERWQSRIDKEIIEPIKKALAEGILSFKGVLYAGLILPEGEQSTPLVLEFNARFGDPETQAIMPLLKSDLCSALWACTEGKLADIDLEWFAANACCVVAVAQGYPQSSSRGELITLSTVGPDCQIFQAGTKYLNDELVTDGGRVLAVVATASDLEKAAASCYRAMKAVSFASKDYRRDIGRRAFSKCL